MRTGNNIRLRTDGRFEARYIKGRDLQGRAVYGYCYGKTSEEAARKRERAMRELTSVREMNLLILGAGSHGQEVRELAESLRVFRKIAFLDDESPEAIGPCERLERYVGEYPVAIAAVGDQALRMRWGGFGQGGLCPAGADSSQRGGFSQRAAGVWIGGLRAGLCGQRRGSRCWMYYFQRSDN